MGAADDLVWRLADAEGLVPLPGMDNVPTRIRGDISRWLRCQAHSCGHSLIRGDREITPAPLVMRVVGTADAWCLTCASKHHIVDQLRKCARCGRETAGGRQVAFSLAGKTAVLGAWCARCWSKED